MPRKKWPLEIRLNDDGTLDEIVCDYAYIHLEQMDDGHWWLLVSHADSKKQVQVNFTSRRKITATFNG